MSRTTKTDPMWVKMASTDPEARKHVGLEAHHDHRSGEPCDLPDRHSILDSEGNRRFVATTRCVWDWTYVGVNMCGCKMCTGQDSRRAEVRSTRRKTSTDYHRLVNTLRGVDIEDEDEILDSLDDAVDARYRVPSKW